LAGIRPDRKMGTSRGRASGIRKGKMTEYEFPVAIVDSGPEVF
jgi:hypothetical protein